MSKQPETSSGITRRDLLKRGAALGGALAWSTPMVQMIGMSPALAQVPSDVCICIKTTGCTNDDVWEELGSGTAGNCFDDLGIDLGDCDLGFDPNPEDFLVGDCVNLEDDQVCIEFHNGTATLHFPEYCTLKYVGEKGGTDSCIDRSPGSVDGGSFNADGSYTFPIDRSEGTECSHIEVCLDC